MKSFVLIALFAALAALAYALPKPDEKYTTKYDTIDLDNILKNNRLLKNYIKCLLDEGPCSPDGSELRKVLPEALQNKCAKCNETQKQGAEKTIKFLSENKKEDWERLKAKFDPDGKFKENYADLAKEHGVQV